MEIRFECPKCGQHLSATRAQIGTTAPCPNCNAEVAIPIQSTLPPRGPVSPQPQNPAQTAGILQASLRFECPRCGQHLSATRSQIGATAPCPNCNAAVTVPKTSTLPHPPSAPRQTKFREKKRYETTVILIDDYAAGPAKPKKLKKWTDDFAEARDWLIHQLAAFGGAQYFAGIFDHKEKRSVFKENARIES